MYKLFKTQVLEQSSFTTENVGPIAYLIHKLNGKGEYKMEIYSEKALVHVGQVVCSKEYTSTCENIDLAMINKPGGMGAKFRLAEDNSYLLFYHSESFVGYRILIKRGDEVVFDSKKPQKGDLYSLTMVKPAKYVVTSNQIKGQIDVNVAYPTLQKAVNYNKSNISRIITANTKESINMMPNEGLIIQFDGLMTECQINLVSDNMPGEAMSIKEQLKSEVAKRVKAKISKKPDVMVKKYRYEFK